MEALLADKTIRKGILAVIGLVAVSLTLVIFGQVRGLFGTQYDYRMIQGLPYRIDQSTGVAQKATMRGWE